MFEIDGVVLYQSTITISGVTIEKGAATFGGGIYNGGTLTINDSTVSENGAYCVTDECFTGGGGIGNSGTLTINRSTISGNKVTCKLKCFVEGGGIFNNRTLTIYNSTISGNRAVGQYSSGGGIANGIFGNDGTVTLQNSIVANNSARVGANCLYTMTSNGYNLSSDNTCSFSGPGDMDNTDPMLGTLGNYGGPTQTIPLLSGSPAIDAGNPGGCTDSNGHLLTTDQRGQPRPDPEDTGGCDMGAYEGQSD